MITIVSKARIIKQIIMITHRGFEAERVGCFAKQAAYRMWEASCSETSIVRWTLEYEKLHPGAPEPTALLDHMLNAAKDIDDHHHDIKKYTTVDL
uniref:Bet v I/Major latex protein domain-containing protein n=1 Tax=Chenopodium quinoa TaxID=63459 RepID=A0A803MG58_CHEQI